MAARTNDYQSMTETAKVEVVRLQDVAAVIKDELADIKSDNSDRDWDNAISSCGQIVPPCPPANGRTALLPSGARG
jgi:hypothetical protein